MIMNGTKSKTIKILLWAGLIGIPGLLQAQGSDDSWKLYDDSSVATVEITVDEEDLDWMYREENVESDSLHPSTVHFQNAWIDETVDSVGFRLRGNTSRHSAKKSFKLDFNKYIQGQKIHGVEKLNLNGEHNDPSIVRSKLCWDFFQSAGMAAPRAAHAAVYINGDYYGLYISVEHIDEEFIAKRYTDGSGNLWKCLWPADLVWHGSDPSNYYPDENDRPYELKTNKDAYDFSDLVHLIDILNNTPQSEMADSLETILAVPDVLKYFAWNILTGSWDDYWFLKNNYYLYYHPAEERFRFIPYDYDNTFSIDWFDTEWATIDPYTFARNDDSGRPLVDAVFSVPYYKDLYTHFLQFYHDRLFEWSLWSARLDSLKVMVTPWAKIDSFRTLDYGFIMDDFSWSYDAPTYQNQHVKRSITQYTEIKNSDLPGQLSWEPASDPVVYEIDYHPQLPTGQDSIVIDAALFAAAGIDSVVLNYHPGELTVIYTYPMEYQPDLSSTRVEDYDHWVVTIPPLGEDGIGAFQIGVTDSNGVTALYPRRGPIAIEATMAISNSDIVINEFLASNDVSGSDEAGEFDDWAELFNRSDSVWSLAGMYLTDSPENLTKWQFNPDEAWVINPEEFLLIWCDDDEEQGSNHTSYKLDADGEFLALVDTNGITILDSLSFGEQTTDVSYGRYPDGGDTWMELTPTPGGTNIPLSTENEISVPDRFTLSAYPNPFNSRVTIQFSLPRDVKSVTMDIFNLNGQRVWRQYLSAVSAGYHRLTWNGRDRNDQTLSSGLYFVRIRTEKYQTTRKIVMLK